METEVQLHPTQELRDEDGRLYTPSTQSLLRTHSLLEQAKSLKISADNNDIAAIDMQLDDEHYIKIRNLSLDQLVPRLHYKASGTLNEFDALNLMLAEYSRNSISVPQGAEGDAMSHYQTNLKGKVPWKLKGDYDFIPNEQYHPLRMSVINNCLAPGLWEINASDRSGEIYHAWFNMPKDFYTNLVAEVNDLPMSIVESALKWKEDHIVKLDLDKLRTIKEALAEVSVSVKDEPIGFSSQGSRRKLSKNYVRYQMGDTLVAPTKLSDLYQNPVKMSSFEAPGIYSFTNLNEFDFSFLATAKNADIQLVRPKTYYNFNKNSQLAEEEIDKPYVEMSIHLDNDEKIIIGNLPLHLLVKQEDFTLHGFGVGILHAAGLAERRKFLLNRGPHPSFAYLAQQKEDGIYGLNSHGRGIEQIFIRSYPNAETPHWEVTITSYERIADLVKYKIEIPKALQEQQRMASKAYVPPVYFTYRDDNIN